MPVSLGDASTGTARSGGAIRSSSPPQNLPLSFPKLLTLSNPCSAYCFGNGDSFGEGGSGDGGKAALIHRLLANRYQFTISERSIQNLEAAMADSDNLTQFMQATAYVRFKPDTEERSTYLYRAYTKWCEDNLESPVPQKKFSQFLLKNAGKYGLTFSKHIEGKYRGFRGVCVHPAFAAA